MDVREKQKRAYCCRKTAVFLYISPVSVWHRVLFCIKNDQTPIEKQERRSDMETRIAVIAIIVEDRDKSEELNRILHDYGEYVVGRMGIPYRSKGVSVISVILDAPQEKISALSGKLGMLDGVSSKTVYSKIPEKNL